MAATKHFSQCTAHQLAHPRSPAVKCYSTLRWVVYPNCVIAGALGPAKYLGGVLSCWQRQLTLAQFALTEQEELVKMHRANLYYLRSRKSRCYDWLRWFLSSAPLRWSDLSPAQTLEALQALKEPWLRLVPRP